MEHYTAPVTRYYLHPTPVMRDVTEAALTTGSGADINNADTKTSLLQIGDYWVVYLLSKNLPPVAMKVSCHVSRVTCHVSRVTR